MEVVRVMNEDRELGLDGARVGIGVWWDWGVVGMGMGWHWDRIGYMDIPPPAYPTNPSTFSSSSPPPSLPLLFLHSPTRFQFDPQTILHHFTTPVSHRNQECGRNLALVIHRTYEGQMKLLVLACDWSSGL